VGAALILGHTGDVSRVPSRHYYARYNATAPIAASSGPRERHRLNPRGNRQLNHALHVAAITQIRTTRPRRTRSTIRCHFLPAAGRLSRSL
jgi:transposase